MLSWLHGDMLGSASVATDAGGNKIAGSDTRYMPFGEPRPGLAGSGLPTDRRYTGQISVAGGLYDYGARFYDPLIGRFLSPDSIVPSAGDPQSLNRFAYSRNNPLRYVDPSGHFWKEALALLGGTILGGAIGLGGETSSQIISEGLSVVSGQKTWDAAVTDFNSVENQASRIGATAGGATTGLIISTASVSSKSVGVGTVAFASIMGGQVEALSGGLAEEKLMNGDKFDIQNAGVGAAKRGLLDPITIATDGGLGVAAGIIGDVVGKYIDGKTAKSFRPEIRQISDFDPITKRPNFISLGKSNVGKLNFAQQVFVDLLKTGWDLFSETTQRRLSDKER